MLTKVAILAQPENPYLPSLVTPETCSSLVHSPGVSAKVRPPTGHSQPKAKVAIFVVHEEFIIHPTHRVECGAATKHCGCADPIQDHSPRSD